MTYARFFTSTRRAVAVSRPRGLEHDRALYVAGLMGALLNRAAETGSFRGAILVHPNMVLTAPSFGTDEGTRLDYGLGAIATARAASITLEGTDAQRLGFLAFAPLHKQANGYDPDWQFDDPEAAMTARCRIIGLDLEIACIDDPDGAATLALDLHDHHMLPFPADRSLM